MIKSCKNCKEIKKLIQIRLNTHQKERDCDGFFICSVQDLKHTKVASKKDWLGTETERQECIKSNKEQLKNMQCDYCTLCEEVLNKIDCWEAKKE